MGFKSDREFLRNVTIGAVGTRQVARLLRQGGFQIIELERASSSNKIWATKVKRLRVPDLLCVRTGIRIESRAKSDLKVAMSHAINNPERAWDRVLRDDDLVAFIRCVEDHEGKWHASERVALFRVRDMRRVVEAAGLTRMKAASEGSEIQLVWPARIPQQAGEVVTVNDQSIETLLVSGRRQRYRLTATRDSGSGRTSYRLHPYLKTGDRFGTGDTIIASVMSNYVCPLCPPSGQYDFVADLHSNARETVYTAVKALGFLPELKEVAIPNLQHILSTHEDVLVRLECAATLARLGLQDGRTAIENTLHTETNIALLMEAVLILSELKGEQAMRLLVHTANDTSNTSELRAAAAWGMRNVASSLSNTPLLRLAADEDELVAVHALVAASRLMDEGGLAAALSTIGSSDRLSASIVRAILAAPVDPLPAAVTALRNATSGSRPWLLYLLAMMGRARCECYLQQHAPEVLREIEFFWSTHVENWTNRLDVADQIDFQLAQVLD